MRAALLLLLVAQEAPEPGLLPADFVSPEPLEIAPTGGDALAAFRDAHEKHKRGDADGALAGYLAFLGNPGRLDLPPRYAARLRLISFPTVTESSPFQQEIGEFECGMVTLATCSPIGMPNQPLQ